VLASNYGAPRHPAWYHNLLANPTATVEIGAATWSVHAREPGSAERRELLDRSIRNTAGVSAALRRTARQLPVLILDLVKKVAAEPRGAHA
jgi:deazaflavin-dependent oxidoreductase (nitroreductase family)